MEPPIKIFTNEQAWSLTLQPEQASVTPISVKQLWKVYTLLAEGEMQGELRFPFAHLTDLHETFASLKTHFTLLEAGGGIVQQENGNTLFIHRRGKWDLPKGKIEKGESIEVGALREVEEECNIKATLQRKIGETWHTYVQNDAHILKCTHWFAMRCSATEAKNAKPQYEEDIHQIAWLSPREIREKVYPNTFRSIIEIYQQFS